MPQDHHRQLQSLYKTSQSLHAPYNAHAKQNHNANRRAEYSISRAAYVNQHEIKERIMHALFFIILIIAAGILVPIQSFASVKVNINRGHVSKIPVAVTVMSDADCTDLKNKLHDIITSDLKWSGLFTTISPKAFLEKVTIKKQPTFSHWRKINAAALLIAYISKDNDDIKIKFRIWDPYAEKEMSSMLYSIHKSNMRRLGHRIADHVYTSLTGDEGYFDSQIVFIAESKRKNEKIKQVAISDIDGNNVRYLTDGSRLALTPRMDAKGEKIAYLSYYNKIPHIFILDLRTGEHKSLGGFPGISFAPRFSSNGSKMLMSIARAGSTSIYEMDVHKNKRPRRLTFDLGTISTSPAYSPDDKKIVFNSDRNGSKQLYVMDSSGKNLKRISFGGGIYASPIWSPRGDHIAFTKIKNGVFYIGVMRPDGSNERLLTSGWLQESPSWSPNGRVIMFSRQTGGGKASRLRVIDISGNGEREVRMPVDGSDPAWSKVIE